MDQEEDPLLITRKKREQAMSAGIYAGNLQRTGEYQTRGLRTVHSVRWRFQTQGHIHFPPLVAHGMVYVGSNDGYFYALGTHTGVPQWRFETECASLSVEKDIRMDAREYTGVTSVQLTESMAYFGTAKGTIYGVDLETGRQSWQFPGEQGKEYHEIFHVAVVDDLLLFRSDSGMSAVNVTTKERSWLLEEVPGITITPSLTSFCLTVASQMTYGKIILSHNEEIDPCAYDLSTNTVVWRNDSCSYFQVDSEGYLHALTGVIPVVNGTAYFVGLIPVDDEEEEDLEGLSTQDIANMGIPTYLMAVDALTGNLQWFSYLKNCSIEGGYTAIANNLAYVVKENGTIFAIDLVTHEALWTRQLVGELYYYDKRYVPPSLADSILYLPRRDGLLTALDALTGQDLWTVQLEGEITTPCTIADGVVYVAAGASVYALH